MSSCIGAGPLVLDTAGSFCHFSLVFFSSSLLVATVPLSDYSLLLPLMSAFDD